MGLCLLTGATGFLGHQLVSGLLKQGHQLVLLVRNPEADRCRNLISKWETLTSSLGNGASLAIWRGDICLPDLGLDMNACSLDQFEHIYHLAAVYDLAAPERTVLDTNVGGTERLLECLKASRFSGRVHVVSSIAIAGDYEGEFSEDMFDEGQNHPHAYHSSKYKSEACARRYREECGMDVRIYRPSAVVGHSQTGEIDKVDGPYYMFLLVSFLKRWLPPWVPIVIPKYEASLDVVPQDYVIDALLCLSQMEDTEGQFCFHLTSSSSIRLDQMFKYILRAADGPKVGLSIPLNFSGVQGGIWKQLSMVKQLKIVQLLLDKTFSKLGIPISVFSAMMSSVTFSSDKTRGLLDQQDICAPQFEDYVNVLWDYYNRHLDPVKDRDALAKKALEGKLLLITGGSSGIGFASARRALQYGARVILVARHEDKLMQCKSDLLEGGLYSSDKIDIYPCDISNLDECDGLVSYIEEVYGEIDLVFSNAGRSIRRSISHSEGRFHDLERTMQLNYFGASRLILGLLPLMLKSGGGHILHSSSMGTMAVTPRFGPYMASKAAMDALGDSLAAEFSDRGINVTSIKFPLVKTKMVAPTKEYKDAELVSPDSAAQMFIDAVIDRPRKQLTGLGLFLGTLSLYAPELVTQIYNYLYQIWPDEKDDFPDMALDRALLTSLIPNSPL